MTGSITLIMSMFSWLNQFRSFHTWLRSFFLLSLLCDGVFSVFLPNLRRYKRHQMCVTGATWPNNWVTLDLASDQKWCSCFHKVWIKIAFAALRLASPSLSFGPAVPNLFSTWDQFHGRKFFHRPGGGGWFRDDSSTLHLLCTLFLLFLNQHHLRSSSTRS